MQGKFHPARISIAIIRVIDGERKNIRPGRKEFSGRFTKIGCKSCDPADARGIIADKGDI